MTWATVAYSFRRGPPHEHEEETLATFAAIALTATTGATTAIAQEHVDITPPPGTQPSDPVGGIIFGSTENTIADPVTGQSALVRINTGASCVQPEDHSQPRYEAISIFADRISENYGFASLSADFDLRDYVVPSHSELHLQWTNHTTGESGEDIVATHRDGGYRLESGPIYVGAGHLSFTTTVTKHVGVAEIPGSSAVAPSASTSYSDEVILSSCNP